MADFSNIIQEINDDINTNGVGAITGAKLNEVLRDMIAAVNAEKQDPLTIDATPTEDSTNPVQSGGVFTALNNLITNGCLFGGFVGPDDHPTYADDHRYYYIGIDEGTYVNFGNYTIVGPSLFSNSMGFWSCYTLWPSETSLSETFELKADKVSGATDGDLAGLDSDGNLTDSGIAASDVATTSDLAGKQDTISDLSTIRSGAASGATAYQKPSGGIPKTDLASGVQTSLGKADTAFQKPSGGIPASDLSTAVQTSLGKADTAVQQVTVGTTTTGNAGTNASVTNSGTATNPVLDFTIPRGADGADGQDGADAVNPFKGWWPDLAALKAAHTATAGDSAYVKDASPATTWSIYMYDSTASSNNYWADSGTDADTSNVQTFASGEAVNNVSIGDDIVYGSNHIVTAKNVMDSLPLNSINTSTFANLAGKYVAYSDGSVSTNANFNISKPFFVRKGTLVVVNCSCGGSAAVLAKTNMGGTTYTPLVAGDSGTLEAKDYSFLATEDMYVACTYRTAYSHTISMKRVAVEFDSMIEVLSISAGGSSGHVIGANGLVTPTSGSGFYYSSPIAVKKGYTIHLIAYIGPSAAAISLTNSTGSYYIPVVIGGSPYTTLREYTYTMKEDGYVAFSYANSNDTTLFYAYAERQNNELLDDGIVKGGLQGKRISLLGDSISTFGTPNQSNATGTWTYAGNRCRYPQNDLLTDVNLTYWKRLIDKYSMVLGINESWAGSRVSNTQATDSGDLGPNRCMASQTRIGHLGANGTPDIILVYAGINDINNSVTLGTFNTEDPTNYTDEQIAALPVDTFASAYRTMLIRILKTYQSSRVVVLLPNFTLNIASTSKLDDYLEMIKTICDYFGVDYIDARTSGISIYNASSYFPDGIHPNSDGMQKLYELLCRKYFESANYSVP